MLRNFVPLVAGVALASAAPAQAIVSPHSHFASWEGDIWTLYPFSYSTSAPNWLRTMQVHEDLLGASLPISSLTFRREGSINGSAAGNVPVRQVTLTLTLAPSVPVASATNTFTSNYAGPGTTVFSGQVNTPAPWATAARQSPTDFDFPITFSTTYAYAGTGAFLWDLAVGTMSSTAERVYLDQASSGFFLFANCAYQMYGSGCSTPNGTMELRGYGQTLGAPIQQITWGVTTTAGPASAPAVWLIGSAPLSVQIPGLCTNLYTNALVSLSGTTDATGTWQTYFQTPQIPSYFGVPLYCQTAAADLTQQPLPIAASNGLIYRAAPMEPAFSAAVVQGLNGNPTGTLLTGRATIVRFN